jgi:outer membrane lipoprotein carrier protein
MTEKKTFRQNQRRTPDRRIIRGLRVCHGFDYGSRKIKSRNMLNYSPSAPAVESREGRKGIVKNSSLGSASIIIATAIALAAVPAASGAEDNVRQLARSVDSHYNHLSTLQADFTEIYRGDGTERVESGTLFLKKPRKMRWEYRSPREKLFVSDGELVWFYLPDEKQLRKTTLKKLDDVRSPLAFLLGKTKLENELHGLSRAIDQSPMIPGDVVVRGVSSAISGAADEVQLEISPANQIVRIVLVQPDGGTTEFRFANWKENQPLNSGLFTFTPPPGVEAAEGTEFGSQF